MLSSLHHACNAQSDAFGVKACPTGKKTTIGAESNQMMHERMHTLEEVGNMVAKKRRKKEGRHAPIFAMAGVPELGRTQNVQEGAVVVVLARCCCFRFPVEARRRRGGGWGRGDESF